MHSIVIDGLPQKFARSAVARKSLRIAIPVLTATAGLFALTRSSASVAVYWRLSDWPNCAATEPPPSDYNRLHIQACGFSELWMQELWPITANAIVLRLADRKSGDRVVSRLLPARQHEQPARAL
jgi:hypothetical protein